jgi:hypothetical protein
MCLIGVLILAGVVLLGTVFACLPRMRKTGIALLTLALGFTCIRVVAEKVWKNRFEMLPDGTSAQAVRDAIWWKTFEFEDGKCPMGYSLHQKDSRVKKEIWFVEFFFPGQYAFGFDSSGKLINRFHYQSP